MFKHTKIWIKLLLMVLVPIIGMLIFAVKDITEKAVSLDNLRTTSALVEYAIKSGALIHELQKERGLSTGFIGSRGTKFRDDLAQQRQETNRQITLLREYSQANTKNLTGALDKLRAADARFNQIANTRANVDRLKLAAPEVITDYTQTIATYLDVIARIAILSTQSEITRESIAYHAFLNAKEQSGRERAILSGAFSSNRFDPATYQKFVSIVAAQTTLLDVFSSYSEAQSLDVFRQKMNAPFVQEVESMRHIALSKGVAGEFNVIPETWFKTITLKINAMKEMEDIMAAKIAAQAAQFTVDARNALILSALIAIIITLLGLLLALIIMRGITTPLNQMVVMLRDIAEGDGDLTKRLNADRRDEIGEVCRWFNRFVENIHGIIAQVFDTTRQVTVAAAQLHSAAKQIAEAAEKVALQSTTVATASEEMSYTAIEISRNCLQAVDVSSRASDHAQSGTQVVQATLVGMQKIAESAAGAAQTVSGLGARSDQIGAIIGTIGDIANQTNLLALNAAIEAARAGEQGRGFAVVADEVRALAERTSKATKEISEMIQGIQKETTGAVSSMENGVHEVERGMDSSRQSGEALSQILDAINDVTEQVQHIATAAEEQTAVTGEISTNIAQITDVVQETATGAHQTANAASVLTRLADSLQSLVGRFKLD